MPNKTKINVLRGIAVLMVALTAALVLPGVMFAAPPSPLTPGSDVARRVANLFWIVLGIAAVIFVLVEALLIFAIVRYRRRYEDEMPEQIHGNATLEIIWTVVPAMIMIGLFLLTLNVAQQNRAQAADAYVVEVVGHQWYWEFRYPSTEITIFARGDLDDPSEIVIPAETPVEFQVTSNDVIHSFWVPELAGKYDAIPGDVNVFQLRAEPGTYAGQCAEFCGLEHWNMLFEVRAVPQGEFDAWMDEQIRIAEELASQVVGPETPPTEDLPIGDASAGETLWFETYNCDSCHSLDGSALVGPSILGIGGRAAERIPDYSAEQYILESIIQPCEYVVSGYQCVMPQNYGEQMTTPELANLLAYLLEQ